MEAEIFLHLLQEYSSKPQNQPQKKWRVPYMESVESARAGKWHGNLVTAIRLGSQELLSVALKGGSAVTMSTLQGIVSKQLSGKVLVETARYQLAKEAFVKGGQAVATKLECQVAMLAARQVQIHFISVCFDGERTSKCYMQEISFVCFLDVQMLRSLKLRVCNWPWLCLEEFRREIAFSITVNPCCQSF
jgi:prolyl oligopeptidase PreP (S9A serine peptidase family)